LNLSRVATDFCFSLTGNCDIILQFNFYLCFFGFLKKFKKMFSFLYKVISWPFAASKPEKSPENSAATSTTTFGANETAAACGTDACVSLSKIVESNVENNFDKAVDADGNLDEKYVQEILSTANISVPDAAENKERVTEIYVETGSNRMDGVTMVHQNGKPLVLMDTEKQVSAIYMPEKEKSKVSKIYAKQKNFPKRKIRPEELRVLQVRNQIFAEAAEKANQDAK
jgi:hypothetical protein